MAFRFEIEEIPSLQPDGRVSPGGLVCETNNIVARELGCERYKSILSRERPRDVGTKVQVLSTFVSVSCLHLASPLRD